MKFKEGATKGRCMQEENLSRLEDSYSFNCPGAIVGRIINKQVARLAAEKLAAKVDSIDKAIEILCSSATRHAYDRAFVEFPAAHKNALEAIAREIASVLVVRLVADGKVPSEETLAHSRRVTEALKEAR